MAGAVDTDFVAAMMAKAGAVAQAKHPVEVFFGKVITPDPLFIKTEDGMELKQRMLVPVRRRLKVVINGKEMKSPLQKHAHTGTNESPDVEYDITIDWSFRQGQRVVLARVQGKANLFLVLGEVDDGIITSD